MHWLNIYEIPAGKAIRDHGNSCGASWIVMFTGYLKSCLPLGVRGKDRMPGL